MKVDKFLRKQLKYDSSLFLFCGSGFSPTPDQVLQDLFDVCKNLTSDNIYLSLYIRLQSFQSGGELVIHYGYQEAWG